MVHPCYVTEVTETDWLAQLEEMAGHPRCVALGEMGLDYYHNPPGGWSVEDYRTRQQEFAMASREISAARVV